MKMNLVWAALAALIALPALGGISVGNGQSVYWSHAGFSVAYATNLSLHVLDADNFEITNEALVGAGQPISKAKFTVKAGILPSAADLSSFVAQQAQKFEAVKIGGIEGFVSAFTSKTDLASEYFFVSPRNELLTITLDAHAAGEGLELIGPIVRSLNYDTTPPVIDQVRVRKAVWSAGSRQKVYVHATDDISGIDTREGHVEVSWPHQPHGDAHLLLQSSSGLKDEGHGWFSISIDVNRYQQSGPYQVIDLRLSDRAGNTIELTANWYHPTACFEIENLTPTKDNKTTVRIPHFRIANKGVNDAKSPRVLEIRPDHSVWKAGETKRLYFRASDIGSGLDVSKIDCDGLARVGDQSDDHATPCQNPRAEGGGWYSVELPLSPWIQSGTYALGLLSVTDKAGNESQYAAYTKPDQYDWEEMQKVGLGVEDIHKLAGPKVFRVEVKNDGPVDLTPPQILEVKLDSTVWQAGEMQTIRFRATDDLSGIRLGEVRDAPFDDSATLVALPPAQNYAYMVQRGVISADGGDWYHITFRVGLWPEIDRLQLTSFGISDRAGNNDYISCKLVTATEPTVTCKNRAGDRTFDPIFVKIVR